VTPPGSWQPVKPRERPARDAEPDPVIETDPELVIETDPEPKLEVAPEPEIDTAPSPVSPKPTPAPTPPPMEPVRLESITPPPSNGDAAPASPTCAFCGRPIEALEYAWPDWLCELLTDHQKDWDVQRTEPGSALTIFEQVGREIDQTSTSVCETCNSGWIQRLEVNVSPFLKPMILGEPTPLPSARRKLLARWAAKTAVVMEGTFPEAVRTPREAAEYLRMTGVHAGTQVLVGRYEGESQVLNRARVLFRKTSGEDHYRSFTTLLIGKLAVQVLADPWSAGVPDVPDKVQRRFIPLVSTNARKVDWPPELTIGDAFFDSVRHGPRHDAAPAGASEADAPGPPTSS
jgi:hypothetical protein